MTTETKYILTFCLLMSFNVVNATVDYLVVNHITKQLYWAETDNPPGLIGWSSIPENKYEFYIQKYLDKGFTFTKNPYLIEEALVILIVLIIGIAFLLKRVNSSK